MAKHIHKLTKTLLIPTFVVSAFSSYAYYYEEHKLISQLALQIATKHNLLRIDSSAITSGFNSTFLCKNLLERNPKKCVTLADLPALAGDHAGSPMLMQWKWFNDSRDPASIVGIADYLASFRIVSENQCQSSETTISKIPNREAFIEIMHRSPDAKTFGETSEVVDHDSNYVRSAAHNCNHFRDSRGKTDKEYRAEVTKSYSTDIWTSRFFMPNFVSSLIPVLRENGRTRFKPKLEAGAWYAQLHATALELASRDGTDNIVAAWIFETFALHFLQDGTAAGHISTPNHGGLSVLETKNIHDNYSENGIEVSIDNVCKELTVNYKYLIDDFKNLHETCSSESSITTIYGDRFLAKTAKQSATRDIAVFLTVVSLHELGNAFKAKKPLMEEQKNVIDFEKDPHWTFQEQGDGKLARKLFAWWESGGDPNLKTSPMAEAAKNHLLVGNIRALELWPTPLEN